MINIVLTVHLHGSSANISRSLSISFLLVVGHTHLSPDWDFEMGSHGSATNLYFENLLLEQIYGM